MRNFSQKHPTAFLLLACYACGLVVFAAAHLGLFAANRAAYANGSLAHATLAVEDFALREMEPQEDGTLLVLPGGDPQMLLIDTQRRVESVYIDFDYTLPPLLVNAFWGEEAEDGSVEYSPRRMAYRQPGSEDGEAAFYLPANGGQALRIDPGTAIGNRITVYGIEINRPRPFWAFFVPGAGEAVLYLALPGLAACGLALLGQAGLKLPGAGPEGRQGKDHGQRKQGQQDASEASDAEETAEAMPDAAVSGGAGDSAARKAGDGHD